MLSSYAQNNYGEVFTAIVTAFHPTVLVELGVLHGYSTCHIAEGIRRNGRGQLDAFDLFQAYQYNHGTYEIVKKQIEEKGYSDIVKLHQEDAFEVHNHFANDSVGFLHVDLSNNGDILKTIMEQWDPKMVQGGVILFEGGSEERDKIDWMIKFNKSPIKPEIDKNPIIQDKYVLGTYLKFPSLTMFLKKR